MLRTQSNWCLVVFVSVLAGGVKGRLTKFSRGVMVVYSTLSCRTSKMGRPRDVVFLKFLF